MLLIAGNDVNAQYFYKDILAAKQAGDKMQSYKNNKVREVKISSFELDGRESDGFQCNQEINKNYNETQLFTRTNFTPASLLTSFYDDNGRLYSTVDSSAISVTRVAYKYNKDNNLESVSTTATSSDDDFVTDLSEQHLYAYDEAGKVEKMTKVQNLRDSSFFIFGTDEKGNAIIEKDLQTGHKYYYYYDDKGRLTDIVQTNSIGGGLIPNYVFVYNTQGQVTEMTKTDPGIKSFLIWKYNYENNLRIAEKCYGSDRKLVGRITYDYKMKK